MIRRSIVAVLGVMGALSEARPVHAADTLPISSLATIPATQERTTPENEKARAVAGVAVKQTGSEARPFIELTASTAQGYCLANRETPTQLNASSTIYDPSQDATTELWRFVEKDETATLERTRLNIERAEKMAWATSRTTVNLREVSRANGVTIWAYRDRSGDVVLVGRHVNGGREIRTKAEETGFVNSDCSWGAARLDVTGVKNGAIAQLHGALPPVGGEGKDKTTTRFIVNASLAKIARDPEPVLAVRIRRLD